MKIIDRLYVIFLFLVFLSGCTTAKYYSMTSEVFKPKSNLYEVPVYEGIPNKREYRIIGSFDASGNTSNFASWNNVLDKAKSLARQKGADAIVNIKSDYKEYTHYNYTPATTSYLPVKSYHQGDATFTTATGMNGNASYSGTSTTYLPIYNPPSIVPSTAAILRYKGELIIFLDKDTYGYMGIKTANNAMRVAKITPGSAAEKAGLKKGDLIIDIGGIRVDSTTEFLNNVSLKVGESVTITFLRDGKQKVINLNPQKGQYE